MFNESERLFQLNESLNILYNNKLGKLDLPSGRQNETIDLSDFDLTVIGFGVNNVTFVHFDNGTDRRNLMADFKLRYATATAYDGRTCQRQVLRAYPSNVCVEILNIENLLRGVPQGICKVSFFYC